MFSLNGDSCHYSSEPEVRHLTREGSEDQSHSIPLKCTRVKYVLWQANTQQSSVTSEVNLKTIDARL